MTTTKKLSAEIFVWSRIGCTPITNRGGSFCDELVRTHITVESPEDASIKVRQLMDATPHAAKGYFNIPEWPNQNTRSRWL